MTIGNTRFWFDKDKGSISVQSSNHSNGTRPVEAYLNKRCSLFPEFKIYESSDDADTEIRLACGWLWFSLNMLLFIAAPRPDSRRFDERDREWGIYPIDNCIVWRWNKGYYSWDIPFISSIHLAAQIMSLDRQRVVHTDSKGKWMEEYAKREAAKKENSAQFSYTYELLNGEKQIVIATVHVSRHIRRTKWTPFKRNDDAIWVEFSEEVGPERGSWKGGCTACGWTLRKGESARQCLRRMESERRFER